MDLRTGGVGEYPTGWFGAYDGLFGLLPRSPCGEHPDSGAIEVDRPS